MKGNPSDHAGVDYRSRVDAAERGIITTTAGGNVDALLAQPNRAPE